jgi:transcriptional regulator with XRE-family HTH domain
MQTDKTKILFPKTLSLLESLGENIRLARLRRKISSCLQAKRAGISRPTLCMIEKGAPSVSLGSYVQVLVAMGMEKDLLKVASDDDLGRRLQDMALPPRRKASRRVC